MAEVFTAVAQFAPVVIKLPPSTTPDKVSPVDNVEPLSVAVQVFPFRFHFNLGLKIQ